MLYTFPDYYKEFHCLADRCGDTCCAGWQIAVDQKSLKKYKRVKGSFANKLKRSVHWKEGAFKQSSDKRCVFLNDANLCDMQLALGEKSLCKTCRRYPRHMKEFENVREITLSLSMPDHAIWLEQLLVYFIDIYFCGAVYDGRVYRKAGMAVSSVFLIYEMLAARWMKNDEILDMEDVIMMVYRYSREVEYSDVNLERLEYFLA